MDLRKFFTTKMFTILFIPIFVLVVCLILFIALNTSAAGNFGINKTVGWAWSLTDLKVLAYPMYFVYLIGYGMLSLFKIKTNFIISFSHFTAITISFLYFDNYLFENIQALIVVVSFILFVANIIVSLVKKEKLNPTPN